MGLGSELRKVATTAWASRSRPDVFWGRRPDIPKQGVGGFHSALAARTYVKDRPGWEAVVLGPARTAGKGHEAEGHRSGSELQWRRDDFTHVVSIRVDVYIIKYEISFRKVLLHVRDVSLDV